ncbi:hypothetical protein BCO18430_04383 [Burkholderia contaminans]|nr:hypothetical protein BCO18430_04383 [Burkholderia contaminans]
MCGLLRRQSPDRITLVSRLDLSIPHDRALAAHVVFISALVAIKPDLRSNQIATVILKAIRLAIFVGQAREPERIVVPESHDTISGVSTRKQQPTRIDLIPRAALIRINNFNETLSHVIPERLASTVRRPDPRDLPHCIRFVHGRLPGRIGHSCKRTTCVIRKPRNLARAIGIRSQLRTSIPLKELVPTPCIANRMHQPALVPVILGRKACRIARRRQIAALVVAVNPARIRRISFRNRQVVVPIPLSPLDLAERVDALRLSPALVIVEASDMASRISRADQLPHRIPFKLPHMAFGIRMARRLLILVPRPARHTSDLIRNRHRTLREIRIERVRLPVVRPVAHDTRVAAAAMPRVKTLKSARQRMPCHQAVFVSEMPPGMAAAIGYRCELAGSRIAVTNQDLGQFAIDAACQFDRRDPSRMLRIVMQRQYAAGAVVKPNRPHQFAGTRTLDLDPIAVSVLEPPKAQCFSIRRLGPGRAEIAIHAIDRFDHIVPAGRTNQVNAFRHAEMTLTRRHRRKLDLAPLFVPVRDRHEDAVLPRQPQLDTDRHAPSGTEQAVGAIIMAAVKTPPDDRQRARQYKVRVVAAVENLAAGDHVDGMAGRRLHLAAEPCAEYAGREVHRKTRQLALDEIPPASLASTT